MKKCHIPSKSALFSKKSASNFLRVKTISKKLVRDLLAYVTMQKWLVTDVTFYLTFQLKPTPPPLKTLNLNRFSLVAQL